MDKDVAWAPLALGPPPCVPPLVPGHQDSALPRQEWKSGQEGGWGEGWKWDKKNQVSGVGKDGWWWMGWAAGG